jgi:hypothetical protein
VRMDASRADLSKILDPKTVLLKRRSVSAALDEIQLTGARGLAVGSTVGRSREVVASANLELDKHKQWLEQHHSLCVDVLDGGQRKTDRRRLIRACGQAVSTTARFLSSVCSTSLHSALRRLTDPRDFRRQVHEKLQKRIDAMDPLTTPAKAGTLSRMKVVRTALKDADRRCFIFDNPTSEPRRRQAIAPQRN